MPPEAAATTPAPEAAATTPAPEAAATTPAPAGNIFSEEDVGSEVSLTPFNVPEGVEVDEKFTEGFTSLAQKMGLSQEDAQNMFDLQANHQEVMTQRFDEEDKALHQKQMEEIKNDRVIGGDNYDSSIAIAKQALSQFGNIGLVKALNESGVGDDPNFVRFMVQVGKHMSEPAKFENGPKKVAKKTEIERRYGNSN